MNLNHVLAYVDADVPVLVWGPPGVGKTAMLTGAAEARRVHLEVLIGSTLDPIDIGGYLVPTNGAIVAVPPPWAVRLRDAVASGRSAWLLLDELSCAPPSVQAALLRVVHDRMVGSCDLAGVRIIAAANPADTAADGGDLAAATANRFAHVSASADAATWVTGVLTRWGHGWQTSAQASAASSIAAYLRLHPTALMAVPADLVAAGRAWPSPRSWTAAIRAIAVSLPALHRAIVAGCVGDTAAAEWATWHAAQDLPDPEAVLSGSVKLPSRGDRCVAALGAMIAAVSVDRHDRGQRIDTAWGILASQRPDVILGAARSLLTLTDGEIPTVARALGDRLLSLGA